jgi:hypothetical protein
VRSFALWRNGSDPSGLQFAVPEERSFRGPLGRFPGIGSANMDGVVLKDDVRVFERRELEDELIRPVAARAPALYAFADGIFLDAEPACSLLYGHPVLGHVLSLSHEGVQILGPH